MAVPALLTVPETAERLRCGERTVWSLIKAGELRSLKVAKSRVIPEAEIERFIAARLTD